jgi:hypothetical protein
LYGGLQEKRTIRDGRSRDLVMYWTLIQSSPVQYPDITCTILYIQERSSSIGIRLESIKACRCTQARSDVCAYPEKRLCKKSWLVKVTLV